MASRITNTTKAMSLQREISKRTVKERFNEFIDRHSAPKHERRTPWAWFCELVIVAALRIAYSLTSRGRYWGKHQVEIRSSTQELDRGQTEIRLISLLPRQYRIQQRLPYVCCFTEVVSRDRAPRYAALSYVWGDANKTHSILLNGKVAQVTTNLAMALEHFEDTNGSVVTLWVDAICINQDDALEKSHQVRIMKEIYDDAAEVWVWLGTPTRNLANAFRLIKCLIIAIHRQINKEPELAQSLEALLELIRGWLFTDDWEARFDPQVLQDFIGRAWWRRVWVLQEVSSNKHISFFCGRTRLHFNEVFLFLGYLSRLLSKFINGNRNHSLNLVASLDNMRSTFDAVSDTPLTTLLTARKRDDMQLKQLLMAIQCQTGGFHQYQATRPEDLVFALLGMASDRDALGIIPDYTKSCSQIYMETATAILSNDPESLQDILAYAQGSKSMKLPTWVPDWSVSSRHIQAVMTGVFFLDQAQSRAAGHHSRPVQINTISANPLGATLTVIGAKFGFVTQVFDIPWPSSKTVHRSHDLVGAFRAFVPELRRFVLAYGAAYGSFEERLEVLWELPTLRGEPSGSLIQRRGRMTNDTREISKQFWQVFSDDIIDYYFLGKAECVRFAAQAAQLHGGRRVFATDSGHIGVGLEGLAEGDIVCFLYGVCDPFILRPVGNVKDRYELVGHAWVSGIMDGEFMATDPIDTTFIIQ